MESACSKYVSGVGTNFTGLAIAAAYNCGIRDFDIQLGYEAALKNEVEWRGRPGRCRKNGCASVCGARLFSL